MLLSPVLHGSFGIWDEVLFAIGFVISVGIFVALALSDHKRDPKDKKLDEDDN